jgi:NADH-quinone oxidoreductase subunit M
VLGVLATAVIVPAAWYLIRLFLGVMEGPRVTVGHVGALLRKGQLQDMQVNEFVVILPLLALIFYIGFQPNSLVSLMEPSVVNTLQHSLQNVGSALIR